MNSSKGCRRIEGAEISRWSSLGADCLGMEVIGWQRPTTSGLCCSLDMHILDFLVKETFTSSMHQPSLGVLPCHAAMMLDGKYQYAASNMLS